MAAVNPFDPKTVLLAKHAQHVVLIHFPIALFITGVGFDCVAVALKKPALSMAAGYNFLVAALSTIPVLATGVLAWQWQLEGRHLKGILLQHVVLAVVSSVLIWLVWWMHQHSTSAESVQRRLPLELIAVLAVAVTGHLGGFLSGVNSPV
jgi:uncharacterized membrane protein